MEKFSLEGRIGLVTGSAGLLGIQHAYALLEVGATVVVTDVNLQALEKVSGRLAEVFPNKVFFKEMDVTNPSSIGAISREIHAEIGSVDILINNAAIDAKVEKTGLLQSSRVENFRLSDWKKEVDVGLTGAFLCSQCFGTIMARKKRGVILNIASDLSVIAPDQRIYKKLGIAEEQQPVKPVTYSVIKTGLIGLTRYLAAYWGKDNVRVNALSPGGIYNKQPDDFIEKLLNLIPLGRMATVDEYRSAVQFLCSDAAAYMTGQNIVMDGGRSVI